MMCSRRAVLDLLFVPLLLCAAGPRGARAGTTPGKLLLGGDATAEELDKAYTESFPRTLKAPHAMPSALPDIFGPGSVLKAGNVVMKITNIGIIGNPFTTSSDPSAQWPGTSGVEYLNAIALAVGGVENVNGQIIRRVTYSTEWRPPSLDPEDKIYQAYEGIIGGNRFQDDDNDGKVDEDFLDGRDNDGDGKIDEDYGANGQQEFSCVMTDFSPQSLTSNVREQHVPLGLQVQQRAWAYSLTSPDLTNFNVIEYNITNVSGNTIDSLVIGWLVDIDAGPVITSGYWLDDQDVPWYPQGSFTYDWTQGGSIRDARAQVPHPAASTLPYKLPTWGGHSDQDLADSALCQRQEIRVNGFTICDDNGDQGKTPGVSSFLLFEHTTDPLGLSGPSRVGFRAFRSFTAGTPYNQGGNPSIDQERFEFMTSQENIDNDPNSPTFGFITAPQGDQKGDYAAWCSVGPWLQVKNGASIHATVGLAVSTGSLQLANSYKNAYLAYLNAPDASRGTLGKHLLDTYPSLNTAFTAQLAYEGVWTIDPTLYTAVDGKGTELASRPDFHGRETALKADPGQQLTVFEQCGEGRSVLVTDRQYYWFDFDCTYCTGIWDYTIGSGNPTNPSAGGLFHKTWNSSSPPPNPITNCSITYNYSANPDRNYAPAGDHQVTVAWDNLSEVTPNPAPPNVLDFRGYKIWKASDWTRPVGSSGPADTDWALLADFRYFDYYDKNGNPVANNYLGTNPDNSPICPKVYIPTRQDSETICLKRGDLWNQQTGEIIAPNDSVSCIKDATGNCAPHVGCIIPPTRDACVNITRYRYDVGRYRFVDRDVKNGFLYFYSVTAYDSTSVGINEGRRSAVEAEGVVPQVSTRTGKGVWVVPNPYRGYAQIAQRPSSWDLTPNATDPTGTHIDFFGMPPGKWTLRIYTVAGDLVQTIRSDDPVNDSVRAPITVNGQTVPGYNKQQDTPTDGEARWNLISRNGQDVVSGIYLFTVDSGQGTQRGKFVIIR